MGVLFEGGLFVISAQRHPDPQDCRSLGEGLEFLILKVCPDQPETTATADARTDEVLRKVTKLIMNQNSQDCLEAMAH